MNKKAIIFLLSMCFLPLMIFFGYFFIENITDKRTNKEIYLDIRKDKEYSFHIKKIYRDRRGHNALTLEGTNLPKDNTTVPPEWESGFFEIGDSIVKNKQSLKVFQFRNNKLIKILDYNNIYIKEK